VARANRVYCANVADSSVTVVNCADNTVAATVRVGIQPSALCFAPQQGRVYVANYASSTVSVIRDTAAGVTESPAPQSMQRPIEGSTMVRGEIRLRPAADGLRQEAGLIDTRGGRVMALRTGANDVRRVAPGVYFVRSDAGAERGSPRMIKVVVVR
jgi:YVTN family beta-propeller protein